MALFWFVGYDQVLNGDSFPSMPLPVFDGNEDDAITFIPDQPVPQENLIA